MGYNLGQWLKGKVDFTLTDSQIYAACVDYGVTPATEYCSTTEKQRDLSLANIYDLIAISSSVTSAGYDSDGGWQHKDAAKNVVNRAWFSAEAKRLRTKHNVKSESSSMKTILKPLY